ncbi:MAG: SpoIIE family protein phosphatase [Solirubrobacterales bacterium]|nr:SpoIIE family protein phosphatase [Solirubrobacterales bacterium]
MAALSNFPDESDASGRASLVLRALPNHGLIVFSRSLRVDFATGEVPGLPDSSGLEGRAASEALEPAQWSSSYEHHWQAALEGRSASVEISTAEDGRCYQAEIEPIQDGAGNVLGGVCRWQDITERKRLIGELDQRGRLMDLAHDAIIVREPASSAVTYWNREATEIYGYSAQEASGRITHDLLATQFPESREAVDEALVGQGRWQGELWHARKDGRRILVSSRQALLRDDRGEPLAVIELNSDITARAEAEAELRLQAEIIRNMAEGVVLVRTSDWTIAYANPKFEQMFGYEPGELTNQPVAVVNAPVDRDPVAVTAEIQAELAARGAFSGEVRNIKKDGTAFWCQANVSNFEHPEYGNVSVAVHTDITERKAVEEERIRMSSIIAAADTLQRSILGPVDRELPEAVAARYRPAVRPLEVGGDWYDVVKLPAGRLGLIVGDCVGRGVEAAAVMGQLRSVSHSLMLQGKSPREVISDLDIFAQGIPGAQCTTVFCALVDPAGKTLRYSSAGHPPAVLAQLDGTTELLERATSVPLAVDGSARRESAAGLTAGCTIALYTDGLVERRGEPMDVGFDRLREIIARNRDRPVSSLATIISDQMQTAQSEDDVAFLLYRLARIESPRLSVTIPADPTRLAGLRQDLREWLASAGFATHSNEIVLSVSEACSNSIEHAYDFDSHGMIDLRAQIDGSRLTLTVVDSGSWKIPDPTATNRGRGLRLIGELMDDYSIETGNQTTISLRKELTDGR